MLNYIALLVYYIAPSQYELYVNTIVDVLTNVFRLKRDLTLHGKANVGRALRYINNKLDWIRSRKIKLASHLLFINPFLC